MNKSKPEDNFFSLINPQKTQIKSKLPFIWVFGAGSTEISRMEQIHDPISPYNEKCIPYKDISSFRAKFIQWSKKNHHHISNYLVVPESYPEWLNFNKYSNLVDFELDIVSISQGVIIFSESIGSYTEIGMFSCFTELHKNILVVVQERHIKQQNSSFFNYGPIYKIRENRISEDLNNVWALEDNYSTDQKSFDELFWNISDHFLDIITDKKNGKVKFDRENKYHVILLLLDLIDLFPSKSKSFYRELLSRFEININNEEISKLIVILDLLKLISIRQSGHNTYYTIALNNYVSCLNYQADSPNKFERSAFKIDTRKNTCY